MYLGTWDVATYSAAGTTQATATVVVSGINYVSTVASGAGVVLAPNGYNQSNAQLVYNAGANPLKIYPPVGSTINGLAANSAVTLATNTGIVFYNISSTALIGMLSA